MRPFRLRLPVLIVLATIPSGLPAAEEVSFYELAKLTAADVDVQDHFGGSVAISGDTAVVGAENAGGVVASSGSAYIFRRDAGGPEAWGQVAKLTAADGAEGDNFGASVALNGDTAVVGAEGDDDMGFSSGSAYIFRRGAGGPEAWRQVAKLTAADGAEGDNFGVSVALSGDTAVVGAWFDDDLGFTSGSAYIFRRDAGGPEGWGQVAKLTAADGETLDEFGFSVALGGDTAVVGTVNASAAYIFRRDAGGPEAWGQVAKLTADDEGFGQFGVSVAISGDTAVVGANSDDDLGTNSGSAYLFRRDAGEPEAWSQVAKLTAADAAAFDSFGFSAALSGDTVIVGAALHDDLGLGSGSAYLFRRDAGEPEAWSQVAKLTAADGALADHLGWSVAISGETVVVGAENADAPEAASGSAYIFQETLVDPSLAISGACPGEVTLTGSGVTPNARFRLYWALAEGSFEVGRGACIGALLDLEEARAFVTVRADTAGRRSVTRSMGEFGCGRYMQVIDLTSCAVSNVIQVP